MNKAFKDYYAILEINKDATEDEIKKQYRRLAKQYHPDVCKDNQTSEEKIADINEAYQILSDPSKRETYNLDYRKNIMPKEYQDLSEDYTIPDDYEDIISSFSTEEQDFIEIISLQKLVIKTINKGETILKLKNDILLSAYAKKIDEKEYLQNTKDWLNIAKKHLESLEELKEKCQIKNLETKSLEEEINKINSELEIPLTIKDATTYIEKEIEKSDLEEIINQIITKVNHLLKEIEKKLTTNQTDKNLDFYKEAFQQLETYKKELQKQKEEAINLSLETEKIDDTIVSIEINKIKMPRNKNDVQMIENIIIFGSLVDKKLEKLKLYPSKFEKIKQIVTKHPENKRSFEVAKYAQDLFHDLYKEIKNFLEENKELINIERKYILFHLAISIKENLQEYSLQKGYDVYINETDKTSQTCTVEEFLEIYFQDDYSEIDYITKAYTDLISDENPIGPTNFNTLYSEMKKLEKLVIQIDNINCYNAMQIFQEYRTLNSKKELPKIIFWDTLTFYCLTTNPILMATDGITPLRLITIILYLSIAINYVPKTIQTHKNRQEAKQYKKLIKSSPFLTEKYESSYGKI